MRIATYEELRLERVHAVFRRNRAQPLAAAILGGAAAIGTAYFARRSADPLSLLWPAAAAFALISILGAAAAILRMTRAGVILIDGERGLGVNLAAGAGRMGAQRACMLYLEREEVAALRPAVSHAVQETRGGTLHESTATLEIILRTPISGSLAAAACVGPAAEFQAADGIVRVPWGDIRSLRFAMRRLGERYEILPALEEFLPIEDV